MDLTKLWKTVLGEIEIEASKAQILTFFRKTALLLLKDNTATIATHTSIGIDLLQKQFSGHIKKSLKKHTGVDYKITFVVKTFLEKGNEEEKKEAPLFTQQEEPAQTYTRPIHVLSKSLARVRAEFTFDTMAVSGSNQLAFVSAQTVAKNIGHSYNPFFIYGPVGVGKTHLMQAIANEVYKNNSDAKIIYITSEEFTNEVVEAIRGNDTARMKRRFRNTNLLIIDDVQFIAGKDRVQEELFHTFNILIDNQSQVVLSSDRPPSEIKKLEKRLSSRFAAGLTVDIEPPDFELRTAVVLIKAKKHGVELPIEIAKDIAQKTIDIRSLEGVLIRIITEAKNKNEDVSKALVEKITKPKNGQDFIHMHPDDIVKKVCLYYDIKPTLLKGPKRDAHLVKARQIAMLLLKHDLRLPLVEIGNILGGRDHTTIMHGVNKMEQLLQDTNTSFSVEIMGIRKTLSE